MPSPIRLSPPIPSPAISSPTISSPMGRRARLAAKAAMLGLAMMAGFGSSAMAQNWHYRDNNIRTFTHYDYNAWRHGYWWQGRRNGRYGWWWYGGGTWYPYPKPIYPYPNPYIPPTVIIQPVPAPSPYAPPPTRVWYYCPSPQGYYPYVPQCYAGWQAVPATPQ